MLAHYGNVTLQYLREGGREGGTVLKSKERGKTMNHFFDQTIVKGSNAVQRSKYCFLSCFLKVAS